MLGILPSEYLSTPFQTVSYKSSRKFAVESSDRQGLKELDRAVRRLIPRNREGDPNVVMFGFDRASREGRMSEHPSEGRAMPRHRGTVGQRLARLGAWALILGVVQFFAFHLIVQSAWPEPYSWVDNNISDLGAVGCGPWEGDGRYVCSPLHAWMNASFVAQGVLLAAGLLLARPLRDRLLTKASLAFVSPAALGFILAGLAPADT